jgi:hypothetical protein
MWKSECGMGKFEWGSGNAEVGIRIWGIWNGEVGMRNAESIDWGFRIGDFGFFKTVNWESDCENLYEACGTGIMECFSPSRRPPFHWI